MTIDTLETVSPLMQKFQAFYELFTEFSHDAAEVHGSLSVHDDTSRAVFASLSRIMAFTDQMGILITMMREDVRVVDELTSDPVTASWTEEMPEGMEQYVYDLLRASKTAAPNVH
jgi:hypothetical protein